ncbi:MAG: DUF5657 family protein [Patescibacteria group bacterium]
MVPNLPIRQLVIAGKIIVILIMVLYAVFAFILTKRVKLMNANLTTPQSKLFERIARIHMVLSIFVIILATINL